MKVVVTGGLGFIGSNIVNRLIGQGHDVLIIETPAAIAKSKRSDCRMSAGDVTNFESLRGISAKNFDAVLHLAGQPSGAGSFEIPDVDIKLNVLGTLNMIKWCSENQIKRLLFASSFVVYGDHPEAEQLSEEALCHPKSIYALTKHTSEQLLKIYGPPKNVQWNVLRMFNVYGPGQDLTRTDQGIVGIFLAAVKKGDYVGVKGRLDRFRDLVYIDDVVQGWERCLNDSAHPNEVYNLGSGTKTHIATLIDTLIQAFDKTGKVKVEEIGTTPGDIKGCFADITKISKELGYAPRFDLTQGVREMVKWAKEF